MVKINENRESFKADVSRAFGEMKTILQQSTQRATTSIPQSRTVMLPDFKTGFGRFVEGKNETEQIQKVVREARNWKGVYNGFSILAQVRKALPLTIMQGSQSENNSLSEVLQALENRYSNEADIFSLANDLLEYEFKKGFNLARQVSIFLDKVNSFNRRCTEAKRLGSRWNGSRAFEVAIQKLHSIDEAFANDVLQNFDIDILGEDYCIEVGNVQAAIAKRERNFLYSRRWLKLKHSKASKVTTSSSPNQKKEVALLAEGVEEFSWPCWKCDKEHQSVDRRRIPCGCKEEPVCGVSGCGKRHKDVYHEAFCRSAERRTSAGNWTRGNTQGVSAVKKRP